MIGVNPTIVCYIFFPIRFRAQYTEGSIDTLVTDVRLTTSTAGEMNPPCLLSNVDVPEDIQDYHVKYVNLTAATSKNYIFPIVHCLERDR